MLRLTLAWLHLLALGVGLGAVLDRASALREPITAATLSRAFRDDTAWGLAAVVWIATGLWRLLGHTEKTTAFYMGNVVFWAKMVLFVAILVLEVWPMFTLIGWRIALGRGRSAEMVATRGVARRVAAVSTIQGLLVIVIVLAAAVMARGYGARR